MLSLISKRINISSVRNLAMATVDKIVHMEEMEKLANDKNVLIIDVREQNEVKSTGIIGSSVNIPLNNLQHALKDAPKEEFSKLYGRSKPVSNSPMIFYCLKGRRALQALELAESLGFKNGRYYKGSWAEWSSKHH
ncbi:rhodanese domain-containing protein CG4456-like isoform X1 [Diorhabda carinulata]|uniref:rhodanese domain-containing protein CG4456-like isoform X1 n=1 Tax=Diorhabda carinulata TaxID=1163345 RepID=UPI0025A1B72F|nr:rhodanese domain-containing protein CG4456-like isoform X1 [Diorhabda carinulata]